MHSTTRVIALAAVGGLGLLCVSADARAQAPRRAETQPVARIASLAPGSIQGVVQDEAGAPIVGATVSALGPSNAFAQTDHGGRFQLRTLSPGPYLVRAHLSGFVAPRGQMVDVRPSGRVSSSIVLRHAGASSPPVMAAAAVGGVAPSSPQPAAEPGEPTPAIDPSTDRRSSSDDDHGETAWRLRHARRGILKDATGREDLMASQEPPPAIFGPQNLFGRAVESSARAATTFFTGTPFSGQFHLLTTSSFDDPRQLFTANSFARSIAYVSLTAPVGEHAGWTLRGAMTQGDLSSWVVAGAYTTRAPERHRYDVGVSYSTQRYDGRNPAALREVTDGSRNAGAMYGFDTFAVTPAISLTYGARYARYDYLDGRTAVSPRIALAVTPWNHVRLTTLVSRRALAPGAEEFQPMVDSAIWLPPQRTFSSLLAGRGLVAERTTHLQVELERDIAAGATASLRAFRQYVSDQLVTMFGIETPGYPARAPGHYFVMNNGDVEASGWSAAFRARVAERMHASVEYSLTRARSSQIGDASYIILFVPSAMRSESERIHGVASTFEANVPETATRVTIACRISNGFARPSTGAGGAAAGRPAFDSRFDVQVRQSLPFMDFSAAKVEMLVAVNNLFREVAVDQSIYDELLVVRPPKRIVGGVTLRF